MEYIITIALVAGGLGLLWFACRIEDSLDSEWDKHDRSHQL